jgi:neopullulanase
LAAARAAFDFGSGEESQMKHWLGTCVLVICGIGHAFGAPKVNKVEPPNWWTPHTYNPIQILLTGSDLKGATVTTASGGFKIDVRHASDDGAYLFLYLDIGKEVRPGSYRFQVTSASGAAEFTFGIEAPLQPRGRFQGFSPDDVIYLLMPDRFANGDPSNDSPAEYGRAAARNSAQAYHGGDFKGVRDHLAYLKDLGVTGVWMTPAYKNSSAGASPYHGYHTVDFYDAEPRFGTMKELRDLVNEAHRMGIKVVQDQVANHTGPRHPWVANPPTKTWFNYPDRSPKPRNNYDIAALADPYARPKRRDLPLRGWFAGNLPDLNQDDPLVRDYLIENALWWVGMTGIDAIRQDTYPYVDRPFWEKWQTAVSRQYPALTVVGEITAPSPAALSFFEGGTRRYGTDTKLPSMLDFPLESAARGVFAQGQPMTKLTEILAQDSLYQRPEMLVMFPGNHDQPRFLTVAKGDVSRLLMAETFALTTRRVAHLYYGDEIAMQGGNDPDNRRDFPGGWEGDPVNAFNPGGRAGDGAAVFDFTRSLLRFRQSHPALRRGNLVQLLVNQDQYCYLRSSPEERVLVVLNRAGSAGAIQLDVDDLGLQDGLRFEPFTQGSAGAVVSGGKIVIDHPANIQIYWTPLGQAQLPPRPGMTGDFELHPNFASKILPPRDVIVYLPSGYRMSERRYPVLYMHDGQNLFDPATGFAGQEWRLDETAEQLIEAGKIPPLIIVGVYNTGGQRMREYTSGLGEANPPTYARLIVEELKPFIDSHYRTLTGPENTGLGGSSLGGLISLAIALQQPGIFGKLAIMSPSVFWNNRVILEELKKYQNAARPGIWLDIGTAEGNTPQKTVEDARALRDALVAKGWKPNVSLRYFEAEGAAHNEAAWSRRIGPALEFLFGGVR